MSDFKRYEDEINTYLSDAFGFVDKLKSKSLLGSQREHAVEQLEQRAADIGDQIEMAQNEFSCTRDTLLKKEWKPILDEIKARYAELQDEIVQLKQKKRDALVTDENDGEDAPEQMMQKQQATDMQKVQIASILYQDATLHLNDADNNLTEVIAINDQITGQLEQDTNKLNRINDELVGLKAENQIAKRQLAELAQRITSNKCYIAIFFAIVVVIFALTIWDLTKTVSK